MMETIIESPLRFKFYQRIVSSKSTYSATVEHLQQFLVPSEFPHHIWRCSSGIIKSHFAVCSISSLL